MSFVSIEFLLFILVTCVIYYACPKRVKPFVLLLANYVFYIISTGMLAIYLLVTTCIIYISARIIQKIEDRKDKIKQLDKEEKKIAKNKIKKQKKIAIVISVIICLGILAVLKYTPFFVEILNSILNVFKIHEITAVKHFLLPLGISYYTLQAISYIVDVYRGKYAAEKNFIKVALYMSFFPLMVEGPISRFDTLSEQLYADNKFNYEQMKKGLTRIGWGFFKKLVIADRAALFVNNVFGHSEYGGLVAGVAIILYTLQIYAEFSGCMDIVIGTAKLLGIKLSENFEQPFFSKSIQEFWRRWHITLGTWLKDYVFYPISLSKMNLNVSGAAKKHLPVHLSKFVIVAFPLFFVWFSNGLWHGASLKYVLYGLYYYVIMMLGVLFEPVFKWIIKIFKINTEVFSYKLFQMIRTAFLVLIGMTIFRAQTLTEAFNMLMAIFTKPSGASIFSLGLSLNQFLILFISSVVLFFVSLAKENKIDVNEKLNEQNLVFRWLVYFAVITVIVVCGIYGIGYDASSFIYGQF